jgi:periplasmic protein CpxP/Spy
MNRKKAIITGSIALAVILTGGVLFAVGHHGHHKGMMRDFIEFKVDRVLADLNLTDDQKQKTEVLRGKLRQEFENFAQDRKSGRQVIVDEWMKKTPDRTIITETIDQRIDNHKQAAHRIIDVMLEFHDLLTPEQRQELLNQVEEMHGHFNE